MKTPATAKGLVPKLGERRLLKRAFAIKLDTSPPPPLAGQTLGSPIRAILRLVPVALLTALMVPIQMIAMALRLPISETIPRFYHRNVFKLKAHKVNIKL